MRASSSSMLTARKVRALSSRPARKRTRTPKPPRASGNIATCPPLPGGDPARQQYNAEQNSAVGGIEPMSPTKADQILATQGNQDNQRIGPENRRAKQQKHAEGANQCTQWSRFAFDPGQKAQEILTQDRAHQSADNYWQGEREI